MDSQGAKPKPSIVRFLPLYFPWDLQTAKLAGCPYTAISILTGEDPFRLRKKYKNKSGLSPSKMTAHFVDLGFEVEELTKEFLYDLLSQGRLLTDAHVILASVRMTYEESSWVVIHGGIMWHNYTPTNTTFVTSMSFPMEYGYKIYTPRWEYHGANWLENKLQKSEELDIEE